MTDLLQVFLHDAAIGIITLLPSGKSFFSFNERNLHDPDRYILSQSFFRASGELIPETKATSGKLPVFFSNLLPEGHMRNYLAKLGNVKPTAEFRLLRLLGQDLPGAVTVRPMAGDRKLSQKSVDVTQVDEKTPYRFSLAGVQLKFSAIAERRGGLTIPAKGVGGDWIIKLPAQNYLNVPENECAMMKLASMVGIPTPEIRMIPLAEIAGLPEMGILAGKTALAVKRFDRASGGKRIHGEDFAQVYNVYPEKKYEGVSFGNIANMVWTLTGESGLKDFIKRLVFTILIGNGDMHLKNWSFLYPDGKTATLSPAYDMVSTIPYIPNDKLALKLYNTRNMQGISLEHFSKLAQKAQIPQQMVLQVVRETVDATITMWRENHRHFELPADLLGCIDKHIMQSSNMV